VSAANFINQHYSGHSFEDIRKRLHDELREIRQDMLGLMSAALEASDKAVSESNEQYVISGERNLLAVRDLSLRGQGVQVFIGGESGVSAPDEVSVVTAPYKVDGEVVGTVGVIGPSRMAYDRVVPIVDITAKLLSSALSKP